MPKLNVPVYQGQADLQPMSIEGVASKVASASSIGNVLMNEMPVAVAQDANIGQAEMQFGKWQAQFANNMISQSTKALSNSIYNLVSSAAIKDYNDQSSQVSGAISAADISPSTQYVKAKNYQKTGSYGNVLDDVYKKVVGKYAEGLDDPESKAKLETSLGTLNNNRKLQVGNQVRSDEAKLAKSSLSQALDAHIQSGLMDAPENLGYYAHQGLDTITAALEAGSITPEQAQMAGDKLRKGLYMGSLSVQNSKDPNQVAQLLNTKTPEELNLSPIEVAQLKKQNQFALADQNNLGRIQQKAQQEIDNANKKFIQDSLATGIESGQVGASQLAEAYNKGQIDYPQYLGLATQYDKTAAKNSQLWESRNRLSSQLLQGGVLSEFSNKQIDDHYLNKINGLNPGGPITLDQKASIAAQYKAPVDLFAKDVKYSIMSNDPELIKQGIAAFDKVNSVNPLVFSNVKDDKFMAYVSSLSNAYKYTNSLDKDGIKEIKDSIYNVDGRTQTARMNQYAKDEQFTGSNIRNTIADMYPQGNPWYRGSDYITNDVVSALEPIFRDAYRATGDADAAKQMVLNKTKGLIGHSDINVIPKVGLDAGTLMFLPPEQVLAGKARPDEIRAAINNDILPELPKGVTPDQVLVGSDDVTIQQFQRGNNPSYYLYYLDSNNQPVLLNKRWSYDQQSEDFIKQQQDQALSAKVGQPNPFDVKNINAATTLAGQIGGSANTVLNNVKAAAPVGTKELQPQQSGNDALIQQRSAVMARTMANTKNPTNSPLLNLDFVEKAGKAATVNQMANDYPGDKESKSVVSAALNRMVGQNTETWRVAQSTKLINSVLSHNASPETYLKYGTSTLDPQMGDIVVTKMGAGLYGGSQTINGQQVVKVIALGNSGKSATLDSTNMVNLKDVKGFRSLPTPENFYTQQQTTSLDKPYVPHFNPYTGEMTRMPTGQERFNPYTGETSLSPQGGDKLKQGQYFDPYTGQVKTPGTMADQIKGDIANAAKQPQEKQAPYSIGVTDLTPDYSKQENSATDVSGGMGNTENVGQGNKELPSFEEQNGKLMNPVIDPNTGKYTDDPERGRQIIKQQYGMTDVGNMKLEEAPKGVIALQDGDNFVILPKGSSLKEYKKTGRSFGVFKNKKFVDAFLALIKRIRGQE